MNETSEPGQEVEALRKRISALSAAILRISASLDIATVLQEAADSARALTAARYGIITTIDEAGEVREFVTSGFTAEEQQQFADWPDGPKLFVHFRDLSGPIRLTDLPALVRSLGFSPALIRSKTFQGTPMRHRGHHVGNFFLAEKEGAIEFTDEDEEILLLFASQAATAITNARTHRAEQRTRADLEALIETSPVGVVVFDAKSGSPVSFNREARRIVERLQTPGHRPEELLDVVSFSRADGREISLAEFPIARYLGTGETVRAEEVVLSVPDGRSVRMLINATPIDAEDGTVASVVVTMQDLAPLDEIERQRAEFLGLVSHELRTPLAAIKGSVAAVRGAAPALPQAEVDQFFRIIDAQADHMQGLIGNLLDAGRIEAGTLSVDPEPSELAALLDRARNTFLAGGARHAVAIDLSPDLPAVMADRQRIVQVLCNLLSNAARHSPESSPLRMEASCDGTHVAVAVSDQGRGVPPEMLGRLFAKHAAFSGGGDARTPSGSASRPSMFSTGPRRRAWGSRSAPRLATPGPRRRAWGSRSARDWSRHTGAAFAPRAPAWAEARGSPSRCPWPSARCTPARNPFRRKRVSPARRSRASSSSRHTGAAFAPRAPAWAEARVHLHVARGRVPGARPRESLPAETRVPGEAQPRILVVDDDPHTLRHVRDALTKGGYAVSVTAEPDEIVDLVRAERPQLVLLDLMLPGTGGIELMAEAPELSDLPVIFISGYGRDETIARAFEAGAVDYIVKPFSPTELTARVGAALRAGSGAEPFQLGTLAIDYEAQRVTIAGSEVTLTATEFNLLSVLALNAGRVVTYDSLVRQIWSGRETGDTNLVRNFVKKLRAKLGEDATKPAWIFNVRGIGYRMANPREA